MSTAAREIYRKIFDLRPEQLPDPSDVAHWSMVGTVTGMVSLDVTFYTVLNPVMLETIRIWL